MSGLRYTEEFRRDAVATVNSFDANSRPTSPAGAVIPSPPPMMPLARQ